MQVGPLSVSNSSSSSKVDVETENGNVANLPADSTLQKKSSQTLSPSVSNDENMAASAQVKTYY